MTLYVYLIYVHFIQEDMPWYYRFYNTTNFPKPIRLPDDQRIICLDSLVDKEKKMALEYFGIKFLKFITKLDNIDMTSYNKAHELHRVYDNKEGRYTYSLQKKNKI